MGQCIEVQESGVQFVGGAVAVGLGVLGEYMWCLCARVFPFFHIECSGPMNAFSEFGKDWGYLVGFGYQQLGQP